MKYIPIAGLIGGVVILSVMIGPLVLLAIFSAMDPTPPQFALGFLLGGSILAALLVWQTVRVIQNKSHLNGWLLTIVFVALVVMTQTSLPDLGDRLLTPFQMFSILLTQGV